MKTFKEYVIESINKDGIDGMATVNGGKYETIGGNTFEVMSKNNSNHAQNIVSLYIRNGAKKLELSGWLIEDDNYETMSFGLAYYDSLESLQSTKYTQKIVSKYDEQKELVRKAHKEIFKGEVK